MRPALPWILLPVLIFFGSCTEDFSVENDLNNAKGCRISGIQSIDSVSGKGLYRLETRFTATGRPVQINAVDSTDQSLDFSQNLITKGDSVFISPNAFFLLDGAQRVKLFQTPIDPLNGDSELLVFSYTYDLDGYLVEKKISTPAIPIPLYIFNYTWVGGNVQQINGWLNLGLNKVEIFNAVMEYNTARSPKSFIYIFPDQEETFVYQNALSFGKRNRNLISKVTTTYFNNQGQKTDQAITTFSNVKSDAEGYVKECTLEGSSLDPFNLLKGKLKFSYFCP